MLEFFLWCDFNCNDQRWIHERCINVILLIIMLYSNCVPTALLDLSPSRLPSPEVLLQFFTSLSPVSPVLLLTNLSRSRLSWLPSYHLDPDAPCSALSLLRGHTCVCLPRWWCHEEIAFLCRMNTLLPSSSTLLALIKFKKYGRDYSKEEVMPMMASRTISLFQRWQASVVLWWCCVIFAPFSSHVHCDGHYRWHYLSLVWQFKHRQCFHSTQLIACLSLFSLLTFINLKWDRLHIGKRQTKYFLC